MIDVLKDIVNLSRLTGAKTSRFRNVALYNRIEEVDEGNNQFLYFEVPRNNALIITAINTNGVSRTFSKLSFRQNGNVVSESFNYSTFRGLLIFTGQLEIVITAQRVIENPMQIAVTGYLTQTTVAEKLQANATMISTSTQNLINVVREQATTERKSGFIGDDKGKKAFDMGSLEQDYINLTQ